MYGSKYELRRTVRTWPCSTLAGFLKRSSNSVSKHGRIEWRNALHPIGTTVQRKSFEFYNFLVGKFFQTGQALIVLSLLAFQNKEEKDKANNKFNLI